MSKQALHFIIDVGNGIDKPYSQHENVSRLKLACSCFQMSLQQKIVNNPTHQIGFSIYGDNESDDGNNQLLYPIQKPNLDLIRKIKQMSQAVLSNTKQGGDTFSAIEHVVLIFRDYTGKKKYNRRAFLFTAGLGQTTYQQIDLKAIAANLQIDGIKLNIIPIDFLKNYNILENKTQDQSYSNQHQKKNAQMLIKLKQFAPQNVQIFPTEIAIELYSKFRTKDTNPVVLFKGDFEITPGFSLPVASFKCIRKQRLNSLGKYDTTIVPFDPAISKEKQIINDVTYICEGDESGTIVSPENIVKAFPYGPNLIPVNNIIEPSMKVYQQKNFKLLGFVDQNKVPRQSFMSQMEIVVPYDTGKTQEEMNIAKKLFTALVYSMKVNKKYGIARYVPRNSKNGVSPRLVGLIPFRNAQRQMLYLVDLPTVEDVREYPFNSLKKSTESQQECVKNLVDKMSLVQTDDQDQEIEYLKTENNFNPVRQYFFQTVFHRALQNETQIPELDPIIKQYISPELKIYEQTKDTVNKIKTEFKLSVKELAKQKAAKQVTIRWNDLLSSTNPETDQQQSSTYQVPVYKKFTVQEKRGEQFDINNPIQSFREMLTNNQKDMVEPALNAMSTYIEKKAQISLEQNFNHLIQCTKKLREGCIQQKEPEFWDEWFDKIKDKIPFKFVETLKNNGYGFINNKRNSQFYKAEKLTPAVLEFNDDLD